ncbi:mucin-2-like [Patiria miniata]|uniref:Max-binding protein MNT n=1 Tax=Patiria miniata TaxID=46514 RepID=A0A914A6Q5_PATMI|nr:mucin-2-like [Patiria miniata]
MSIDTLLEAAKFVEQIGQSTRGQNDPGLFGLSQNGQNAAISGPSYAGVSSSPGSSPGSHKSWSPVASSSRHQLSTSNTDTFDEGDDKRSGTREVHNKLEKNRRAQLKECFDNLRDQIPNMDNKKLKPSNLSILQGALRYLQALKRKERELEYETERLARQKILYQEKLAKLSGCSLPPWKKAEPEPKEEEEEDMQDDKEDDRDSVSTSTSTASEAEEEERKSRAQSPEKAIPAVQMSDPQGPPMVRSAPLMDHVIKVTQSVKEQSGPFLISRQIVTRVPVSTGATPSQQQQQVAAQMPVVVKAQQVQGSNTKKTNQSQTVKGPATQMQPLVAGAKPQVATAKDITPHRELEVVTQRVAATQKVVIRPQSVVQQVKAQPTTTQKSGTTKQPPVPKPPTPSPTQQAPVPKITSHVVRQFHSHSSAVSAVQEHLKNRAQNKLPQQHKNPVRTISHATPTTEPVPVKANVSMVTTAAVATASSTGVSRQTVSQLLGKQSTAVRQPVRRTDNKAVMQRVLSHPFSPRPQTVDIMPKSPTTLTSSDTAVAQVSQSTPKSITVVAYKEPPPSNTATSISAASSSVALSVSKQSVPSSIQHVTPPPGMPGLDMRNLIIPHYLPTQGLTTAMLRPSLTNPGVLTAANAALLNQAMVAGSRNVAPQLPVPASKDSSPAKLQSSVAGSVSFFSTAATQQSKASTVSQTKAPSLSYTTPVTPGHPFLAPGLTLQPALPALTQVLFTQPPSQPPIAYTIANSSPAHMLVKTTVSPPSVIRHPLGTTAGTNMPHIGTTIATVVGTSTSNTQTTVAMTIPPVVTIGALSLNPLLHVGTNRALVTAPTYTTLSHVGQYPHYRFPFAGQVPIISPVTFTGNPSSAALPVTSVGNPATTNGKTSNGVIVHTVAVPAAIPVTSSWLNATGISNGIPVKELVLPVPATTSASNVVMVTTQPAVTVVANSSQEGSVVDSKSSSGSKVLVTSSS